MAQTVEEKKEQRAVEYLRTQLDMDQPETVLQIYAQIIEQDVFHTEVGFVFLNWLKDYLLASPAIDNERIPEFVMPEAPKPAEEAPAAPPKSKPVQKKADANDRLAAEKNTKAGTKKTAKKAVKTKADIQDRKSRKRKGFRRFGKSNPAEQGADQRKAPAPVLFLSLLLNVVLIAMVVVMFVLTLTSDSPNILNYKNELEDEYASWDEELTMREQAVKKREAAVEQAQQQLNGTSQQETEQTDLSQGSSVQQTEQSQSDTVLQQSTDTQPQDTTTEQMKSTEDTQGVTAQPSQSPETTTQELQRTDDTMQDGTL